MTERILVNKSLSLSRQPTEHKLDIRNQIGEIVHKIDDGYWLIKFPDLIITVERKKYEPLQWYVHKTDLTYA